MEILDSFRSPWVVLSALPWVLLLAWLGRRLLGAARLSLTTTLLAGLIGYALGLVAAVALVEDTGSAAFGLVATVLVVALVMVTIVVLEMLAVHRPVAPPPPRLAVPRPLRAARRRIAVTRRFSQVTRIAVRHGLGGVLGLDRRDGRATAEPTGGEPVVDRARQARRALEEAGGVFVKLGQLLSTRVDVLPLAAAQELARLQENASPAPPDAVRKVLEADLGRPVDEVFADFDWRPIAAASLGQVYGARLPGGEDVVVKVQRPGIAEVVDRDLAIVRHVARVAERRTDWGRSYGVTALAEEFSTRLREELDYRVEAGSAVEVAAGLETEPRIHVPDVHEQLSTARVLVTERLRGRSVGQLESAGRSVDLESRTELADTLLRAELAAMLAGERFHADPHPGNVFLLDDGRIGLLDLGATGRLDAFERSSVVTMLSAVRDRDPVRLREAVLTVASAPPDVDVYALDRALARFMAQHLDGGRTPDAAALSEVLAVTARFGMRLPPSTTTMFRALVTLEGTLRALVPGYALMTAVERVGRDLMASRLEPAAVGQAARDGAVHLGPVLLRAPYHLDRLATLVERGELRMRTSHLSDPRDVAVLTRLAHRGLLAFLGGAVGTVSALLLLSDAGPMVAGATPLAHILGYVGLAAGAVLVLRVLLEVLQDPAR
ncbi:MAG TPA: AarF/UbiB family protein [Jiangellales bacterium]|nr:AarF/UbiB family protein [Jiangellales bacterium]